MKKLEEKLLVKSLFEENKLSNKEIAEKVGMTEKR